jgi:hypothetical protein
VASSLSSTLGIQNGWLGRQWFVFIGKPKNKQEGGKKKKKSDVEDILVKLINLS